MSFFYQYIANVCIKHDLKIFYYLIYKIFKFFLNKKIILNFRKYKFAAYPQKKELSRWMIRNLKIWDNSIIDLIAKKINQKNSIFIDVGCNYGAYSIPLSKIKNIVDIYCFDTSKKSLDRLIENIELNKIKKIKYFNLGIGEKNKTVFFDDNIKNYKNSGSFEINHNQIGYKMKVNSIDNLIEKRIINPKKNIYIKIDVEGYDFFALKGLVKTIRKYNVFIVFEFSKKILEHHKNLETDMFNFIKDNDLILYNTQFIEQKLKKLFVNIKKLKKNYEVLDNFILVNKQNFINAKL